MAKFLGEVGQYAALFLGHSNDPSCRSSQLLELVCSRVISYILIARDLQKNLFQWLGNDKKTCMVGKVQLYFG